MKNIAIIGSGGHANSLADIIYSSKKFKIVGYFDLKKNNKFPYKYLGKDSDATKYGIKLVAMGIGINITFKKKKILIDKYQKLGFSFPKIIHISSCLSEKTFIDDGVQIFSGSIINTNTQIDPHVVINTGSIIEHDCHIGENSFICPGSVILGSSKIGKNTIIGTKSVILPGSKIKDNSFIKAKI